MHDLFAALCLIQIYSTTLVPAVLIAALRILQEVLHMNNIQLQTQAPALVLKYTGALIVFSRYSRALTVLIRVLSPNSIVTEFPVLCLALIFLAMLCYASI